MKGAGAFRRRSFFSTFCTAKGSFLSSSTSGRVISRDPSSTFLPSSLISLARNCGGSAAFRSASIDQYSTGTNAAISFSRSTTSRTATLCTRPAESPRRTFFEDRRDLIPDESIEHAPRLLRVVHVLVQLERLLDRFLDRFLGDLVEEHALRGQAAGDLLLDVPGDGLAFAIRVGGEQHAVGVLGGRL